MNPISGLRRNALALFESIDRMNSLPDPLGLYNIEFIPSTVRRNGTHAYVWRHRQAGQHVAVKGLCGFNEEDDRLAFQEVTNFHLQLLGF
jgi:hypothetical protein